ncbi:hypothetical protein ES332_D05G065600v1 [Gossypium tomentosum]|uniref:Uncharacterized protein n=1 Tax=Gossypium tomentosum TaxID=34277 RepID=A0A5D2KS77_GOSTO|nr:hypothetical protein ES332_D05G065600v1 [Gossypium tomentosum]TYH69576.1 hypothetical protein ES332_D05G065600v1 [Gossypium tomentosum]
MSFHQQFVWFFMFLLQNRFNFLNHLKNPFNLRSFEVHASVCFMNCFLRQYFSSLSHYNFKLCPGLYYFLYILKHQLDCIKESNLVLAGLVCSRVYFPLAKPCSIGRL